MSVALALLVRRPRLGSAPRRLIAAHGERAACALQERLVDCALEDFARWAGQRAFVLDPADAGWPLELGLDGAHLMGQAHDAAPTTLATLYSRLREDGFHRVAFLWEGVPTLVDQDFDQVVEALARDETAIVPAADGTIAVLGIAQALPPRVRTAMTSTAAAARLADACRTHGHAVRVLPERAALRQPQDVPACVAALAGDPRPARRRLVETIAALGSAAGRRGLAAGTSCRASLRA